MNDGDGLSEVWRGFTAIGDDPRIIAMWVIAALLMYIGITRRKEPLLLVPISIGILLANMPLGVLVGDGGEGQPIGFLRLLQDFGLATDVLVLLVFLGLGAAVDFEPMLSNPKTLLLGVGAQAGVFIALIGAILLGMLDVFDFDITDAAAIGIIGGVDGPTTIFIGARMNEIARQFVDPNAVSIVGVTAVAAYSYMALVPIIQPPIIKMFTTKTERRIRMPYSARPVSKRVKIIFPVAVIIIAVVLAPYAAGLIGMMMFGNLLKESGVVPRLVSGADNLMNIAIILLGLALGATLPGSVFLQPETLAIFFLGLIAFVVATIVGIMLAKLMNLVTKTPVNPMIGAAGVSAVPMSARVVQDIGREEDPQNFLLMHAMGPNVAAVIGTAVIAGIFVALVPTLL